MGQKKTMSLDAFKEMVKTDTTAKDRIVGRCDMIDLDNGVMRIYPEHLNKYLEKYCCKTAEDLTETLWYSYGVFCEIKD
jgi:hypothetical protein